MTVLSVNVGKECYAWKENVEKTEICKRYIGTPDHTFTNWDLGPAHSITRSEFAMSKKNLLRAIKALDVSALKTQLGLLKVKENTNYRKKEFMDVLCVAVTNEDVHFTKELVEAYTDWHTYKYSGNHPILEAAKSGHRDVMEILVKSGADIETVDKIGNTVLAIACKFGRCDVVKYLLSIGAQVNVKVEGGKTVLMLAVQAGHLEVVKVLLDDGHADLHALTKTNDSALMYVPGDAAEIAELLCERGASVNDRNDAMETALVRCLKNGGKISLNLLDCLLTYHANVNIPDKHRQTPLMLAIAYSHTDEIIERLVSVGAVVNVTNHKGTTPLEYAARRDRPGVIKVLVHAGVNLNTTDIDGNSALMLAFLKNCSWETIELLIDNGIDVNIQNHDKGTAMSWIIRRHSDHRFSVLIKLIDAGANLSLAGIDGAQMLTSDLEHYKWIEERPKALFRAGIWVTYQLHRMIARGIKSMYQHALSLGAMPHLWCLHGMPVRASYVPDVFGTTPVSPLFTAFVFEDIDFARKLLDMNFLNVFDLCWPDDQRSALMAQLQLGCKKRKSTYFALARSLYEQPWSLFTLCFVKISTCIGFEPDRPKKLSKTGLPISLQRKLMFGTQLMKS